MALQTTRRKIVMVSCHGQEGTGNFKDALLVRYMHENKTLTRHEIFRCKPEKFWNGHRFNIGLGETWTFMGIKNLVGDAKVDFVFAQCFGGLFAEQFRKLTQENPNIGVYGLRNGRTQRRRGHNTTVGNIVRHIQLSEFMEAWTGDGFEWSAEDEDTEISSNIQNNDFCSDCESEKDSTSQS